ncbi:MAG: methyltransferase domain-containing protein [Candidatus Paceibacterota bacterium]
MNKSFYKENLRKLFTESKEVIDIGGGLRISNKKGNWFSDDNNWMSPLLKDVEYKIMDPVDTYHPDIIGDIHHMPFPDNSIDAIVCISVLEHVEDPIRAAEDVFRVIKPGGFCFIYVPFLFYYHAEKGYYGDFWRFTEDSIRYMFKDFSDMKIKHARGAIETWIKLSPFGRVTLIMGLARLLDRITGKKSSKQTSGFYVMLTK